MRILSRRGRLAAGAEGWYVAPAMDERKDKGDVKSNAEENESSFPRRTHIHREHLPRVLETRTPSTLVSFRLWFAAAGCFLLMVIFLFGSIRYAQRDWSNKNSRARSWGKSTEAASLAEGKSSGEGMDSATASELPGRPYKLSSAALEEYVRRLSGPQDGPELWLLQAYVGASPAGEREKAYRLGLAARGDGAAFHNAAAAIFLGHQRITEAQEQLWLAEQSAQGATPAIFFNRALCAVLRNRPKSALMWVSQYLARAPKDAQAARLQYTLLMQAGEYVMALDLLRSFLKDQPPTQSLYLDAARLAARLNRQEEAMRYLEESLGGQPLETVVRIYQSPTFRDIRLGPDGAVFTARLAQQARAMLAISPAITAGNTSSPAVRLGAGLLSPKVH